MPLMDATISVLRLRYLSTFLKVAHGDPAMAQTGPALRGDTKSMKKHLELLRGEPELENLYTFVSRDIEQSHKPSKERKSGD